MKWAVLCLLLVRLDYVTASGKIEIQFIRYRNPDGEGSNGNKCDGLFIASSECDQYFQLCLDTISGDDTMASCPVGDLLTGNVHNQDSFDFTSDIGGTPNPAIFGFSQWYTGGIKIKVDVWDHDDSNDHDHVETLPPRTVTSAPYPREAGAPEQELIISGRTSLTVRVKVYCDVNYYGPGCGTFCSPQNSNTQGHYSCSQDGARQCHTGWHGYNCDLIDGCASTPCRNGGRCETGQQSADYQCVCVTPYTGKNCETLVTSAGPEYTTASEQTSAPLVVVFSESIYTTPPPESDSPADLVRDVTTLTEEETEPATQAVPEDRTTETLTTTTPKPRHSCDSGPCQNGATCRPGRGDDLYNCVCVPGYEGRDCEELIDNCFGVSCGQYGSCMNGINTYSCSCEPGWTGSTCESDLDECKDVLSCKNGAVCENSPGSYNCTCSAGWDGQDCGSDIDECQNGFQCANGGSCDNSPGSFSCTCVPGYTGAICEEEIECPCENGGECEFRETGVRCRCPITWTGVYCEIEICDSIPCKNQGTCQTNPGGFSCQCPLGFSGEFCQTDIDECESSPCHNGAVCEDHVDSYSCRCTPGFVGRQCDKLNFLMNPEKWLTFTFPGTLSSDEVDQIRKAIVDVMADAMGVPHSDLNVTYTVGTCTSKGEEVTLFEYRVTDPENHVIPWYNVEEALDDARKNKDFSLPRPLHGGSGCTVYGPEVGKSTGSQSGEWKTILIVVIGLLCALLIALTVGFALYYRHQNRSDDTGLITNPLFRYAPVNDETMPKDSGRTPRNFRCHSEEIPGTKFDLEEEE